MHRSLLIIEWCLRHKRLPILPVVGNHEYWGNKASSQHYVTERFPLLRNDTTWYAKQHGNLGLIWLNSNHGEMSDIRWADQVEWYNGVMHQWNQKADVKGIIVFAHHPPYTNSIIVSSDLNVQNYFVDLFCRSPKAVGMVTGHAHGYEHFDHVPYPKSCVNPTNPSNRSANIKQHSAHFIVSGGGGGPRPNGLRKEYKDAFAGSVPRPFNFVLVQPMSGSGGVKMSVYGLQKGHEQTNVIETFDITF